MCLVLFAYKSHQNYPLVLAANRDEFYNRSSIQAHFWEEHPAILAGKDVQSQGTWLGVTNSGKIGLITNYRHPRYFNSTAPSRGKIVLEYLASTISPDKYINKLRQYDRQFNGFNLLLGTTDEMFYYSSVTGESKKLKPGVYGLCNHLLDTPWPKVESGKDQLKSILNNHNISIDSLKAILLDDSQASSDQLPETGVGLDFEKLLSSIFIKSEYYGTKSSTIVVLDNKRNVDFSELTYEKNGVRESSSEFRFKCL